MNGTEVNEIDFIALKQLSQKRDELKIEEKNYNDTNPKEYLKSHKKRKKTEKAIFKLIKEL